MQTPTTSLIETVTQVGLGFLIATALNFLVLPWWGFDVTVLDSMELSGVFVSASLVRSYLVRRFFELRGTKADDS